MSKLCCQIDAIGECYECGQRVCSTHGWIETSLWKGREGLVHCEDCAAARDLLSSFERDEDIDPDF